jgi:hypothetical protein
VSKHSKVLDEDKLRYACYLIKELHGDSGIVIAQTVLDVLQFGQISMQDMLDWLENTGGEE